MVGNFWTGQVQRIEKKWKRFIRFRNPAKNGGKMFGIRIGDEPTCKGNELKPQWNSRGDGTPRGRTQRNPVAGKPRRAANPVDVSEWRGNPVGSVLTDGFDEYVDWLSQNPNTGRVRRVWWVMLYDVGGIGGCLVHVIAFLSVAGVMYWLINKIGLG